MSLDISLQNVPPLCSIQPLILSFLSFVKSLVDARQILRNVFPILSLQSELE